MTRPSGVPSRIETFGEPAPSLSARAMPPNLIWILLKKSTTTLGLSLALPMRQPIWVSAVGTAYTQRPTARRTNE